MFVKCQPTELRNKGPQSSQNVCHKVPALILYSLNPLGRVSICSSKISDFYVGFSVFIICISDIQIRIQIRSGKWDGLQ